jgi:hypothetical protein
MADKITGSAPRPMPTTTGAKEAAPTTPKPVAANEGVEEIATLQTASPAAAISAKATLVTTALVTVADLPLGMRLGAKGQEVAALQAELAKRGARLNPTGTFDSATVVELKKAQKALGLPQTGVVDAATLGALQIPPGQGLAEARAAAGERAATLAVTAEDEARTRNSEKFCATGVFHALQKAGLEPEPNILLAAQYGDKLAARDDMREIQGLSETDLRHLPPGAIIVYGKNAKHTSGHVAVVTDELIGGEAVEASDHLQPVKLVGNAASYGTDFGHGATGGPRFRVFIPADPPAKS